MSGRFNPADYDSVDSRISKFWVDHPEGRISTELTFRDGQQYIFRAEVFADRDPTSLPISTGWAEEMIGSTNVNKTSALENCETSAIGRALANYKYAAKARPSQTEMAKAGRQEPPKDPELYRERALSRDITVEQLRELHATAAAARVLEAEVTDADGAPTTLGDLIVARGKALAPKAAA